MLFVKTKLNTIKVLISKALNDSYTIHDKKSRSIEEIEKIKD